MFCILAVVNPFCQLKFIIFLFHSVVPDLRIRSKTFLIRLLVSFSQHTSHREFVQMVCDSSPSPRSLDPSRRQDTKGWTAQPLPSPPPQSFNGSPQVPVSVDIEEEIIHDILEVSRPLPLSHVTSPPLCVGADVHEGHDPKPGTIQLPGAGGPRRVPLTGVRREARG